MNEKKLRELLLQRLHMELLLFKDSVLQKEKEDIFRDSYKIEVYVNLYEIFMERAGCLKEDTIRKLLNLKSGILETIYQEWLDKNDIFYEELCDYVSYELVLLLEMGQLGCDNGTERRDRKESDQAA